MLAHLAYLAIALGLAFASQPATCNLQLAFSCINVDGNTGNVGKESNLWILKTYSVVNSVHDH